MAASVLKGAVLKAVDRYEDELKALSTEIWENPELAFKEYKAHQLLSGFLEQKGFKVQRSYGNIETAFKATYGSGMPNVCVICEYDALPEIGHACGHNLIAEAGIAAGLGIKEALETEGAPKGTVTVLGTPAEEEGGGKVELIRYRAFKDIDVAMMVHPFPDTYIRPIYNARKTLNVHYAGKAAHAAAFPWEGTNALDAAVTAYSSIAVLRQQMKPTWRVHTIITEGGVKPNIIPDNSKIECFVRAPNMEELSILSNKVTECFQAAAQATGCAVDIAEEDNTYTDVQQNATLGAAFARNYQELGVEFGDIGDVHASTDMGNVSNVVPSLHPNYAIGTGEVNHTREFTAVANTPAAHHNTLLAAKAMACTAIDVLITDGLLDNIKKNFIDK